MPAGGRLWHINYALDIVDGSQYVLTDYRPSRGETTITVKEASTRHVLFEVVYGGYAGSPRPSPVSKEDLLLTGCSSSFGPADYGFINLRTRNFIDCFSDANVSIDSLPDGRFLQLGADGRIVTGTPRGARSATGSFNLQGRRLGSIHVSAQGTQFMVRLTDTSTALTKTDLWVANTDGGNAGRLTSTDITRDGHWSPDGRHIAFDADTGVVCNGEGCLGTCEIWCVPSTARNANPLPSFPGEASRFRVRNRSGGTATLGCELLGWVR